MVFYEITAKILNLAELMNDAESEDRKSGVCNSSFQLPATKVYSESKRKCCIFIQKILKSTASIVLGAYAPTKADVEKYLPRFLEYAGIRTKGIKLEETTVSALRSMFRQADRQSYIEDEDFFMDPLELTDFLQWAPRYFDYSEDLLTASESMKQLHEKARILACEDTILPELDRIIQGAAHPGVKGHPVHYQILADDDATSRSMTELILNALFQSGRISNQRFGILHCDEDTHYHKEYLEMAFRYCSGGALAIDLKKAADKFDDGDQAQAGAESIVAVCDCVKKFKNSVLTILCLPREAKNCKKVLQDNLGTVPLVELKEDLLFGDRSKRFLRRIAKQNGITAPRSLMKQLDDPEHGWLPGDLKKTFDRWFSDHLRKEIYPQYASFEASSQLSVESKPMGSAYSELEAMIGLGGAKAVIQQALDYYKAQKVFRDRGLQQDTPSLHMVFTGNPGTAKTTVARLFARIMKENGVLSHGNLHEVGRGDLVGKYVGWTAPTVQRKFREAKGSVLFIDEAYSLMDDRGNSFGDEAINTIVQEMENCRGETVVIFAGYPDQMEQFLDRNPGLRSRIAFHVPFENYTEDELYAITESLAAAKGLSFGPGVREKLLPIIRTGMRMPDFGNGRFARGLLEKATMCQASRLVHGDVVNVTDKELRTLLPEDFNEIVTPPRAEPRRIGFCA